MEEQALVAAIVAEVYQRLSQTNPTETVVIGPNQTPYPDWTARVTPASCKRVLITQLSVHDMAQLALGSALNPSTQFILEALLLGKKVYLLSEGLLYRAYKNTAFKPLYNLYLAYETQLNHFGVQVIDHLDQLTETQPFHEQVAEQSFSGKLLTAKMVQDLAAQGIKSLILAHNSIITPQAADLLKDYKIMASKEL